MLAARRCGLDMICRTLRERKSRLTPRRTTILSLLVSLPPGSGYAISAGHRTTDKTSFIIRARRPRPHGAPHPALPHGAGGRRSGRSFVHKGRAVGASISRRISPLRATTNTVARDSTGRENLSGEGPPGFLDYASARDSVCACNHYTQSRGQPLKISGGFTHSFTRPPLTPPPHKSLTTSACKPSNNFRFDSHSRNK